MLKSKIIPILLLIYCLNLEVESISKLNNFMREYGDDSESFEVYNENPYFAEMQSRLGPLRTDPDLVATCGQLLKSRGFQYEIHYVTTSDGYILKNYRIINKYALESGKRGKPFLLLHGAFASCASWLFATSGGQIKPWINGKPPNDTSDSLAFLLANLGYDVWLINDRGNTYSTNHTNLDPKLDGQYWNFTYYELAIYDVPAVVNHIKNVTGQDRISVVGHSQGTVLMIVQLSVMPEMADNYDLIFLAGIIAFLKDAKGLLGLIPASSSLLFADRLGPNPDDVVMTNVASATSCQVPLIQQICVENFNAIYGPNSEYINKSRAAVFASLMDQGSYKTAAHFLQARGTDQLSYFDYGSAKNLALYGSAEPPKFPFENIDTSKLVLISSRGDYLSTLTSVQKFRKSLSGKPLEDHLIPAPRFGHESYEFSFKAYKYFGSYVSRIARKYLKN